MGSTGRDALILASPGSSQKDAVRRAGPDVMRRGVVVAKKPLPSCCRYAKGLGIGGALAAPACAIGLAGICGNWIPAAFTGKWLLTVISWCGMLRGQNLAATRNVTS